MWKSTLGAPAFPDVPLFRWQLDIEELQWIAHRRYHLKLVKSGTCHSLNGRLWCFCGEHRPEAE